MTRDPTSEFASGSAATLAGGQPTGAAAPGDRAFFGHPRGLATLFFTEMWERFSYYGLRALLILFMTASVAEGGLGFDTVKAGAIVGIYTGAVYLLALPGGWIADRIIGQRRSVLIGGIIIACGHFTMALPMVTRAFGEILPFYLGLSFIVLGTGLLKPNVSAMVGELYPEGGARRDAGFSIFYMGINIGAFAAPLIVGFLGQRVNWHLGFAAAGLGMFFGLVQYVWGGKHLGEAGLYPDMAEGQEGVARSRRYLMMGIVGVVALLAGLIALDVSAVAIADAGTVVIVGVAFLYLGYVLASGDLTAVEKKRVVVIGILFLAAAVFWMGFEQASSSLNLVAERLTNLDVAGFAVPATWLQSVNPLFIIALAPVFAWLWIALGSKEPSSPAKFAVGLLLLGIGFLVMTLGTRGATDQNTISPMWLVSTYFFLTCGELFLSPVGLSTMTKLAPHGMVGQMMGIWFMASALGNLLAGRVGGLYEALPLPHLFGYVALTAAVAGLLLAVVVRPVEKLTGGVR